VAQKYSKIVEVGKFCLARCGTLVVFEILDAKTFLSAISDERTEEKFHYPPHLLSLTTTSEYLKLIHRGFNTLQI
jgi:hypothetical protein